MNSERPLRRDAAANRERLLASARELFATRGLEVSLPDIAEHAGVGVATAYRLASKAEIVDALFEEGLVALAAVAHEALADDDAWQGLVHFLEGSLLLQFGDRGLTQLMTDPSMATERAAEARDRIAPLITRIVERAVAQGVARPDLDQTDLVFAQVGLAAILQASREVQPELHRRYLALFLDGIRADGVRSPLPVPALSAHTTHEVMSARR